MRKYALFAPVSLIVALGLCACTTQKTPLTSTQTSLGASQNASATTSASSSTIVSSASSSTRATASAHSSSKSTANPRRKHVQPIFSHANDVWRGVFPLSATGKKVLHDFLEKAGLPEIALLQAGGGNNPLTSDVCKKLFRKYMAVASVKVDHSSRCSVGVADDGTFADGDPLTINLSELDGKYLLLMIDEEGLGGDKMFSYVYTIANGEFSIVHREKAGDSYVYYDDGMLYFVSPDRKLTYTYDLETKELTKRG